MEIRQVGEGVYEIEKWVEHQLQRWDSHWAHTRNVLWCFVIWLERSCENGEKKDITLAASSVVNLWSTSPHRVYAKNL